ncbi:MAG TPA: hypothetical protein VHE99_11790 [Gammaproteobacteria bacterium]|nr:hypothetical protein [Gammaproteobacteria bacterium]
MKKAIIFCVSILMLNIATAESINMSLNATKNAAGLGHEILALTPKKTYQFSCELTPKTIPPAGTIFLDITLCAVDKTHHCPFAYSEGHADLKQPVIYFKFTPQQQYMGEKTNFSVMMQYIPHDDDQTAVARYHLACYYI